MSDTVSVGDMVTVWVKENVVLGVMVSVGEDVELLVLDKVSVGETLGVLVDEAGSGGSRTSPTAQAVGVQTEIRPLLLSLPHGWSPATDLHRLFRVSAG